MKKKQIEWLLWEFAVAGVKIEKKKEQKKTINTKLKVCWPYAMPEKKKRSPRQFKYRSKASI